MIHTFLAARHEAGTPFDVCLPPFAVPVAPSGGALNKVVAADIVSVRVDSVIPGGVFLL